MRRTRSRLAALPLALAVLALLVSSAVLPAAPPPAPAPGLPKGAHPLSPALAQHMDELVHAAEEYRGLRLKRPVPYGALGERELKAKVAEALAEDLTADQLRALSVSLQAFGLVPEGANVEKIYRELLGQQVAAFYDPERKYLAMVERQGENGSEALGKALGADFAHRALEGILVHELTHALDDQHFGIGKAKGDPLVDGSAAYLALVEGDATVTMFDYVLGKRIEAVPGFGRMMGDLLKDPGQLAGLSPDLPGSAGLADAPAWFRDTLVFSYLQGFSFCLDVERVGGQKLLDYAFAKDPPRSTEQILHPEKWHGRRDDPVGLAWPDLAAALPGWKKAAEGEMGEEGIGILLRQELHDANLAAAAAAGWGGDRFAVYTKDGKRLLLWLTEWDTEAEAAELQTAAARLPQGASGWKVVRPAPTRVVLTRGGSTGLAPESEARVEAALAAVPAQRPANRDIDLAALGIAPPPAAAKEPPSPGPAPRRAAAELSADGRTYTDSEHRFSLRLPGRDWTLSRLDEGEDVLRIAGPGEAQVQVADRAEGSSPPLDRLGPALAEAMRKNLPGGTVRRAEKVERGGTEWYEIETEVAMEGERMRSLLRLYGRDDHLLTVTAMVLAERWPAEEAAVLSLLDSFAILPEPPDVEVQSRLSADGGTYSNPELGFSIHLPRSEAGWRWDPKRHGAPVLMASPDGTIKLAVHPSLLPAPSLEAAGRTREAFDSSRPGRRKLRAGLVRQDGREFYELEFETEREGERFHESERLYQSGGNLLSVWTLGRIQDWPAHERAIREAMDGFTLTAVSAPASVPPR